MPLFFPTGLAVNGKIYSTKFLSDVPEMYNAKEDVSGLVPFCQEIIEGEGPAEDKRHIENAQTSLRLQLRPIENVWANLKQRVYSNNFVTKTED